MSSDSVPNDQTKPDGARDSRDDTDDRTAESTVTTDWLLEEESSATRGQFRITTLLSWTAVIALLFGSVNFANAGSNLRASIIILMLFGPPLTCIPALVDHLIVKQKGLEFSAFGRIWMALSVGIYSCLMLMLATVAFSPSWKGSKGMHWIYYVLDGNSGLTLWPIYFAGAILFIHGLLNSIEPRYKVIYLLGSVTCALISIWYFLASALMRFTLSNPETEAPNFMFVPLAAGICYLLYAGIILRQKEYSLRDLAEQKAAIGYWLGACLVSIVVKYPLALRLYTNLADEPPDDCFVVTAATRGHRRWVGTWYDQQQQRWLNQQLLVFWAFERRLQLRFPRFHSGLRRVYNRVGPFIARWIVYRWQADCVYVLLKPLEWIVRTR